MASTVVSRAMRATRFIRSPWPLLSRLSAVKEPPVATASFSSSTTTATTNTTTSSYVASASPNTWSQKLNALFPAAFLLGAFGVGSLDYCYADSIEEGRDPLSNRPSDSLDNAAKAEILVDSTKRRLEGLISSKGMQAGSYPPFTVAAKGQKVISGHLGWVRSIAFDPGNEWFCTGSADRTIKIWDTATGKLKLTLTGHIEQIRGLAVSKEHTYLFSAGDDKQVKCWDLEQNKVIRSYHGHLSGVYCLALHPTIDALFTGGRDSVCRVWDIRTKAMVMALSGHDNTVCSVFARPTMSQATSESGFARW